MPDQVGTPILLGDENKRHSIDDSIQLENALMTPEPFSALPRLVDTNAARKTSEAPVTSPQFDASVVATIVADLRSQIAQLTKERDDVQESLQESQMLAEDLRGSLQALVDKCNAMQLTLDDSETKERELQDTIANLRNKLEESRRALMRFQSENRRQSAMTLDTPRTAMAFGGPPSARRTSFAPLTGSVTPNNPHRRFSSVGGSASPYTTPSYDDTEEPGSQTLTLPNTVSSPMLSSVPRSSRRTSGFFNRPANLAISPGSSPPKSELMLSRSSSDIGDSAFEAVKRELAKMKAELEDTRRELTETKEARDASDAVAKALREYISTEQSTVTSGSQESVKLPPLPSSTTGEETDGRKRSGSTSGKGWGLPNFWRVDTTTASGVTNNGPLSTISASPSSAPGPNERALVAQQPPTNATSSSASSQATASPPTQQTQHPGMHRKFGSFWSSSRASISSLASVPNPLGGGYATSDTSSIVEPRSPSEGGHLDLDVRVASSSAGSGDSSPELTTQPAKKAGALRARLLEAQGGAAALELPTTAKPVAVPSA